MDADEAAARARRRDGAKGLSVDIEISETGPLAVVAPRGELDLAVADRLRRTLTDLVDRGKSRIVIDLAAVPYLDSSGLGALVATMKHTRAAGGELRLCGLQADVRTLFELTRLIRVMDIHATRQEALAAWR